MNKIIFFLALVAFLPQSFSNDKDEKQGRSFLEIYKVDQESKKKNLIEPEKEDCFKGDYKCVENTRKESVQAGMFGNKSKPEAVREYQLLCIKCCAGQVPKEGCNDFKNSWGTNKNCGCE